MLWTKAEVSAHMGNNAVELAGDLSALREAVFCWQRQTLSRTCSSSSLTSSTMSTLVVDIVHVESWTQSLAAVYHD